MKKMTELESMLRSIDHKGYPAYKSLAGSYDFTDFILSIDHVQGDPFASPSRLSIYVNRRRAGFPEEYLDLPHKRGGHELHPLPGAGGEHLRPRLRRRGPAT